MATVATALAFSRAQLQSDSNGLTDAKGLIFANSRLYDFHRQLVTHGVDASQLQEAYCDGLVPAAGNGSTFLYPEDCLALKTVEVNFTDTSPQNYKRARQVDAANLPAGVSFSWLRQNATTESPQFDDRGDWYEIFPAFTGSDNISQAIRLFYYLKPTEYASTASTIAYPLSLDYRILGWGICADFYYSLTKMAEGEKFEDKYQKGVNQYIQTLARGSQQPIEPEGLQITGWEF